MPAPSAPRPLEFRDAALVLLAHGSTLNAGSADPAILHRNALRARGLFAEVHAAFWKQEPFVGGALRRVTASRVFLVPLFVAEGWFTGHVLPRALGLRRPGEEGFARVQFRDGRTVHWAGAVGSHPSMTEVLLARAAGVVAAHPFPRAPRPEETALVLVGHGTAYSRGSRDAMESQVALLRQRSAYAETMAVFLEEEPRVDRCLDLCRSRNLVVLPFFISDGLHTREDIPVLLGEPESAVRQRLSAGRPTWPNPTQRSGRRVWVAAAVGSEPALADVILERVREAAVAS